MHYSRTGFHLVCSFSGSLSKWLCKGYVTKGLPFEAVLWKQPCNSTTEHVKADLLLNAKHILTSMTCHPGGVRACLSGCNVPLFIMCYQMPSEAWRHMCRTHRQHGDRFKCINETLTVRVQKRCSAAKDRLTCKTQAHQKPSVLIGQGRRLVVDNPGPCQLRAASGQPQPCMAKHMMEALASRIRSLPCNDVDSSAARSRTVPEYWQNSDKTQTFAPAMQQHLSVARIDERPPWLRITVNKTRQQHMDSDTTVVAIA